MTFREKEILQILKSNPMISQQEIADMLNISRTSVAVHITNLMKKGELLGKGYILKKENSDEKFNLGGYSEGKPRCNCCSLQNGPN